jgi:hypothetical protein
MADSKSKTKKVREMGPPKSAMQDWREEGDPTGEQQRIYDEAFSDAAESLGVSPQDLTNKIGEVEFAKSPGEYGSYNKKSKKLKLNPGAHETKEEFRNTTIHEIFHAADKEHRGGAHGETSYMPEKEKKEAYYWTPSLMQVPMTDPETGKKIDVSQRDAKLIKLMKEWGIENPEEVVNYQSVANELFGPGAKVGVFKNEPSNPEHGLSMEEKSKRLRLLRERGWGK